MAAVGLARLVGFGVTARWAERRFTAREIAVAGATAILGSMIGVSFALAPKLARAPAAMSELGREWIARPPSATLEPAPSLARRVARFRIEYPEVDAVYPSEAYVYYPIEFRSLFQRADRENDLCHSAGDDPESYRGCNRRDAILSRLSAESGWCPEGTEKADLIGWKRCTAAGRPGPIAPSWSEASIARIPWDVSEIEQPCAEPAKPIQRPPILTRCAEAGFQREDALLNAAYGKLMGGMEPAARAHMRVRQREWLKRRDADAAECAAHVTPDEASLEVAAVRCRTGMTIARRRDLSLVAAIADQVWNGHPQLHYYGDGNLDDASLQQLIDNVRSGYPDWQLRNREARAKALIGGARGPGAKAAANLLFFQRPYDPALSAKDRDSVAKAILRNALSSGRDQIANFSRKSGEPADASGKPWRGHDPA